MIPVLFPTKIHAISITRILKKIFSAILIDILYTLGASNYSAIQKLKP